MQPQGTAKARYRKSAQRPGQTLGVAAVHAHFGLRQWCAAFPRAVQKTLQPVQPSVQFARVPTRTPNPWSDAMERGTQVVGANLTVEPWEAQALLALARQLTPQANERGCVAGASTQSDAMQFDVPCHDRGRHGSG